MNEHFTRSDLIRTSEAFFLFSLVLLVPGYVAGWLTDVLAFRKRLLLTRSVIAVPLSIGVCPIITFYLWRISFTVVWLFYGLCAFGFLLLVLRECRSWLSSLRTCGRRELLCFGILSVWISGAVGVLIDLQIDQRLYFPTVTYDYALRSAFTAAITRSGVPPPNPYFFPGHAFSLRYHYFWLLLCSIVQKMAGNSVSARQALLAGTIWCGVGLLASVALYLRFFSANGKRAIDRRVLIGTALLGITGLDIVPVLFAEGAGHAFFPTIEWWNRDQVTAWIAAVLWAPHHVAGLIACLTGFLVIWNTTDLRSKAKSFLFGLLASMIFASALGLTIYVTLVFAVFLFAWATIALARRKPAPFWQICGSGLAALLWSIPFLLELFAKQRTGPGTGQVAHAIPLQFAVRQFSVVDFALGLGNSFGLKANLVNLICLPLNYFLELGFYFLVGMVVCKRLWRVRARFSDAQLCGLTMLLCSIAFCTFLRSSVLAGNDLGGRGIMIAQFILLLWCVDLLADGLLARVGQSTITLWDKRAIFTATLVLGAAGTLYELVKVRFYPIVSDSTTTPLTFWLSPDRNLGLRTFALRGMYEQLRRRTPADAVLQHNPNALPQDNFSGMYAGRQVAAETPSCSVHFGGDAGVCQSRIGQIKVLFDDTQAVDASQLDGICRQLSIDVLVVKDTDPIWRDRGSWIWRRQPIVANNYGRAFACSSSNDRRSSE